MSDSFQQLQQAYLEAEAAYARNIWTEDVTHFIPGVVCGLTTAVGIFCRVVNYWFAVPVLTFGVAVSFAAFISIVLTHLRTERTRYESERLMRMTTDSRLAEKYAEVERFAARTRRWRMMVGAATMVVYATLDLSVLFLTRPTQRDMPADCSQDTPNAAGHACEDTPSSPGQAREQETTCPAQRVETHLAWRVKPGKR